MTSITYLSLDSSLHCLLYSAVTTSTLLFAALNAATISAGYATWMRRLVLMDLLTSVTALGITEASTSAILFSVYWALVAWATTMTVGLLLHLFIPLGYLGTSVYGMSYWLTGSAVGLWLMVYAVIGAPIIRHHLDRLLRDGLLTINYPGAIPSAVFSRLLLTSGAVNRSWLGGLWDVSFYASVVRGIYPMLNWTYQVGYFGTRLWLVFVLHSFCMGCFGELLTVSCDGSLLLATPWMGFLGLGMGIGLMMTSYLMIQIYVYVNFSVSFMAKIILSYFRVGTSSYRDSTGPALWLVPVSLVDFIPTHSLVYIGLTLLGMLLCSRYWLSSDIRTTYSVTRSTLHSIRAAESTR